MVSDDELTSLYVEKFPSQDNLLDGAVGDIVLNTGVKHKVVITNWFTPLNFDVVFSAHADYMKNVFDDMNRFYDSNADKIEDVVFESGGACVVKDHDGVWRRAVLDYIDNTYSTAKYSVVIADFGYDASIEIEKVKKVLKEYGRFPPLAVKCRLKDCRDNICYGSIVEAIRRHNRRGRHRMISFGCTALPLTVNLFDMKDHDLFERFFGPLLRKEKIAQQQREQARAAGLMKARSRLRSGSSTEEEEYEYASDEDPIDLSSGYAVMTSRRKKIPDLKSEEEFPPLA